MNVHEIEIKKNPSIYGLSYTPEATNYDNDSDGPFRSFNVEVSQQVFDKISEVITSNKDKIKGILEIGVHSNNKEICTTNALLNNKLDSTIYLGVDIENKSHIDNENLNIHTFICNSYNQTAIRNKLKKVGLEKITVLMIDGDHSINTVVNDWKYVDLLDENGIIIFHDCFFHPGPYHVIEAIDRELFKVEKYFENMNDYGLASAFKRQKEK